MHGQRMSGLQLDIQVSFRTSHQLEQYSWPLPSSAKVSDLSNFRKESLIIFGPGGVFAGRKDIRRGRTSSSFFRDICAVEPDPVSQHARNIC
jgi:hypothetical protein